MITPAEPFSMYGPEISRTKRAHLSKAFPIRRNEARMLRTLVRLCCGPIEIAAEWWLAQTTDADRPKAIKDIIERWTGYDLVSAAKWLQANATGPDGDVAKREFVNAAMLRAPEAAMSWANSISNTPQRVHSMNGVYHYWRGQNEAQANDWLAAAKLPPEIRSAVTIDRNKLSLTGRVFLEAVNRLRQVFAIVLLVCIFEVEAGTLRIAGIPSRQSIVVQVVPQNPAIAKLPPPMAPGIDGRISSTPTLPPGVEIEPTPLTLAPAVRVADGEIEAAKKVKISTERERLKGNAVRWQQERAASGSITAMRSLGMRHLSGDGVEKDELKGMDLLRKAAAGGEPAAKKELAKIEAVKKD